MFTQIKPMLMIYFFMTLLTLLLDYIDMIIQFSRFAAPGNNFSEIVLVVSITALIMTNYIWFAWIWHAKMRMPVVMKGMSAAFVGFSNTFVTECIQTAKNSKAHAKHIREAVKNRKQPRAEPSEEPQA
jgi:hypothetical protein